MRGYASNGRFTTVIAPPSPAAPIPSTPTTRARANDTTPPQARRLTQVLGSYITQVTEATGISTNVIKSQRKQDIISRPRFVREVYTNCLLGQQSQ